MTNLLNVNEIAEELDTTTQSVYKLLKDGSLKGFKTTGRITAPWRALRGDVVEYKRRCYTNATPLEFLKDLFVDNGKHMQFLMYRYRDELSIERICHEMKISAVTAHKLDNEALDTIFSNRKMLSFADVKDNQVALRVLARTLIRGGRNGSSGEGHS